jgi:hypothetical protein|tara:strand:- start:4583 stop:4819 length:237 start_codon:yes stop_codon:yes gene_type:complete
MKTVTGQVSITISPEDEKQIALEYLCKEFGWSDDLFIQGGMVKERVLNHTTHAWEEVKTLREADELDTSVDWILRSLK